MLKVKGGLKEVEVHAIKSDTKMEWGGKGEGEGGRAGVIRPSERVGLC